MKATHVYFPPTTPQQRKLLYETWEQTDNVTTACKKAHVGRATFYYWKPRFDKDGYAGLENYEKTGVPKGTGCVAAEVETKVLELHDQHADWGKHRLANEIAKANNWVPLLSPNTVRRVLEDAGMWKPDEKKSGFDPVSRTADLPGQALNVDLCFGPVDHRVDVKLPAVSGSSGHLVVERLKEPGQEPDYPGKVFANLELDYAEAVQAFVKASQPLSGPRIKVAAVENPSQRDQIQQLRLEEAQLRTERRNTRKSRKLEDAAWQATWHQQRCVKLSNEVLPQPKQRVCWGSRKAQEQQRKSLRKQHRQQSVLRKQEDAQWRSNRINLREQMTLLPIVTAWIAILMITDNCTRQCLGLPLFIAGSHVTAEMVVAALRVLLPANLQFLISDRGIHFTADVFKQLAKDAEFVHVVIARHRPQSNGIAERFVRTLKEWLADKAWQSDKKLLEFLHQFLSEYNDRPHQGLPIPGLSPDEYAKRIWLM
ncbi:MAG: integrase core domain-containing protein [Chloroflexi bacterium]|nr:integrase core domain-containing protein [Chloroflexota bacterium]